MNFWWVAAAVGAVSAVMLFWPLLRQGPGLRSLGLLLMAVTLGLGAVLYHGVGTPAGRDIVATPGVLDDTEPPPFETLVSELQQRLDANPEDLEGWMLLGRSFKTLQRYTDARDALRRAQALAPDDPVVQVELAEALIFTSGEAGIDSEVRDLLTAALEQEPQLQKGLWLMGIVDSQAGDDAAALAWWERLLPLLEPGSGVAESVAEQARLARQRLGQTTDTVSGTGDWPGIEVTVQLPDSAEPVPPGAVLFLIARDVNAPQPPLGAMRIDNPEFPLTARLTDANSMLAQRPISSATQTEVLARLSLNGQPIAATGDLESAPAAVKHDDDGPLTLRLDVTIP